MHGCPTQDPTIFSWSTVCDTNSSGCFHLSPTVALWIAYCIGPVSGIFMWKLKQAGDLQAFSLWAGKSCDGYAWHMKGQDLHLTHDFSLRALHVPDSMPGKPAVPMTLLFHPVGGCIAIKSSACLCSLFLALLLIFHPSSQSTSLKRLWPGPEKWLSR